MHLAEKPPLFCSFNRVTNLMALVVCGIFASHWSSAGADEPLSKALSAAQWQQVDTAVDRGIAWLATQQLPNGRFRSGRTSGQPAITSLCVMAMLSRGHRPGIGPHGESLNRAIDFALKCQREEGLLCLDKPTKHHITREASHTATYNHAITGVMLGEVYGMTELGSDPPREQKLRTAIERALTYSRRQQLRKRVRTVEQGGVRYIVASSQGPSYEADLSVTAWHLMFYRSAKNAEFDVPADYPRKAMNFVRNCHVPSDSRYRQRGAFSYFADGPHMASPAMTGCGLLSLSLGGAHRDPMSKDAADWLLAHPSRRYDDYDRYSYAAYYCSQAMAQMGGEYWREYFPSMAMAIVRGQEPDGSWNSQHDTTPMFGRCYPTSMAILALTPAYQMLPIYQR